MENKQTVEEIEQAWQASLRKFFPSVVVREVTWIPEEDDFPFLGVFMIPDKDSSKFFQYQLDELWKLIESDGLPNCVTFPYTVSQTREQYPKLYAQAVRDAQISGSAKKSKKTTARPRASSKKTPRANDHGKRLERTKA